MLLPPVAPLISSAQPPDPAWRKDLEAWRERRKASLMKEDGWLTLVGLHWLKPGENAFGGDGSLPVPLAGKGLPARAGVLVVSEQGVRIRPLEGAGLLLGTEPLVGERAVRTDHDGRPDVFHLGGLAFHIVQRNGRYAVRVKDAKSPVRSAFRGIPAFRPDPAFRVVATFEPYPEPKSVEIPTIVGYSETMSSPGRVRFTLKGREYLLEPVIEDPAHPELFFVFRDLTSGHGSYPAGRFLVADMPKDGKVVLDFNRAYNPPCAFTPYATCPLPPPSNWLRVAVKAGEKAVGHP